MPPSLPSAQGGAAFFAVRREKSSGCLGPATGRDTPGRAAGMTDRRDWVTPAASGQ
jgi:hypothetical protein